MLEPSENFGAEQIRFLQNEATEWIQHVNKKIIEAANEGKNEARIDIRIREGNIGQKFYKASDALIEHFKSRGFDYEPGGQSYITFKW
jgi:hypothetical protein